MDISGVTEELLGSQVNDQAGILAIVRQAAGLTTLQPLFDNLDTAMKSLGEIIMMMVQNNYTPGKVARILGEEPTEAFYNQTFGEYNCVVEEAFDTPTQKQMECAQLIQFKQLGAPIPWSRILDSATLQKKDELIKSIQEEEQQASQSGQQQMQAQLQLLQAQIEDLQGKAKANIGLGVERFSRVEENRALAYERIEAAKKDGAQKDLDYVKAVKELIGIDLDQLAKAAQLLEIFKPAKDEPIPTEEMQPEVPNTDSNNLLTSSQDLGYNAQMPPSGEADPREQEFPTRMQE